MAVARLLLLAPALAACAIAFANPALTGTWSGNVDGQRFTATFDGKGGGNVDGRPIRYMVQGQMLYVEDKGAVTGYMFQVQGDQLAVAGGVLPGVVTMARGTGENLASAMPNRPGFGGGAGGSNGGGGVAQDLVGKWCKMSNFSANAGGGSSSSACFELRGDGSYVYGSERSMSAYAPGAWGGTSGSSSDAGRWTASGSSITAHSRSGQVSTYQLERRNHPKNRDPMVCLDGECYVTYFRRNPW